ncbi:ABC transporter permease [Georgenia sp. Z1344]|uniref:ABC transporter permease n=1 Tax=Georgenia sp. Z1344 TaxID=3416706 RepID=UPI003CEE658C
MTTNVQTASAAPAAAPTTATTAVPDAPGISLGRLVQVELRKMVDTRSGFGLLAAILVIDLAAMLIVALAGATDGLPFEGYLSILLQVQLVLLPIVGVLAASQEWSQRTTLQTFALEPRRSRVIVAKIAAALVLALVITVISVAFAAGGHALSAATDSAVTADWALDSEIIGGLLLNVVLYTLMGVAFGLLLHAPAIAIVLFFLLPMVLSAVSGLFPDLQDVLQWVDPSLAWTQMFMDDGMDATGWAQIATSAAIWVVAPMVGGWYRTVRREAA